MSINSFIRREMLKIDAFASATVIRMFNEEHWKTDSKEKEIMKLMPLVYALIFLLC